MDGRLAEGVKNEEGRTDNLRVQMRLNGLQVD